MIDKQDFCSGDVSTKASNSPVLRKHMPELDVLRGAAIFAVVMYHGLYWSGAVPFGPISKLIIQATVSGWLGVNLFFVLSGFLITGILLDTKGQQSYYRRFYLRRVVRILPAYFATILVLVLLHRFTLGSTIVALLFLANYDGIYPLALGYWPFWSLSVEEQFYLFWPMLVANVRHRTLTFISFGLCLLEPLLRYLSASGRIPLGEVHLSTYLIADNLAMGALVAIFVRSRHATLRNAVRLGLAIIAAGVACLFIGIPFGILHRTNVFGAALQTVPWNFIFTGTLLLLLGLRSPLFSGPYTAPLRFLGYISYGLYLSHLLIFDAYDTTVRHISSVFLRSTLQGSFTRLLLAGTLAVLVAWLSRRFFEGPFLRMAPRSAVTPTSPETSRSSGRPSPPQTAPQLSASDTAPR